MNNNHKHIKRMSIVLAVGWIVIAASSAHAGWVGSFPGTNGRVNAVVADTIGNIYVGGSFTSPGNNIAKWNGTSWQTLGGGLNGPVYAIAIYGTNVYAAGIFTGSAAQWDGASWTVINAGIGSSPVINALAVSQTGKLYAGGQFSTGSLMEYSFGSWGAVTGAPTNGSISALVFAGSTLYAGGSFTGSPGDYVAQLSGTTWSSMGNPGGDVTALAVGDGGKIYAGGSFADKIVVWNGTSWIAVGSGGPSDGVVLAIAYDSSENLIYAGGTFTAAGSSPSDFIAAWKTTGSPWTAVGGVNNQINALAFYLGRLYAGGTFTSPPSNNIGVYSTNLPPTAITDSYSVAEDGILTIAAPGVLTNDTDPESGTLTAVKLSDPLHGSLTLNTDGSFTYTPSANYNGADSFTYKANDGKWDSASATVNITVTGVNDPPAAVNNTYTAVQDQMLTIAAKGVLTNDTDVDGNPLTASLVTGPLNAASFTLNPDGSFSYLTHGNTSDSFTYNAYDGTSYSAAPAMVIINVAAVNHAPTATPDSGYSTNEDTSLTIAAPGVLANDADSDGDTLSAVPVSNAAHGTVSLNANGAFTYTPHPNYYGSDSFSYKAFDGIAYSNAASATITINSVNDAPIAMPDTYVIAQNTPLTIPAPGVLSNDKDAENNPLTPVMVTDASHGSVILNPDGSFTYTPYPDYFGPDSFTYKARDNSLAESSPVTVSFQVDVPAPAMISVSVNADTALVTGYSNTQTAAERGFFWWTDTASSGLIPNGTTGIGNFSMTLGNFTPTITYKVSAYIKVGTQLITAGNFLTFTAAQPLPPTVRTDFQFSINGSDITATGEIISMGSKPVSMYGFVYNTVPTPTVWDKALPFTWDLTLPISIGKIFSGTIRNLAPGKYYLRAYAHNSAGTSYGEQIEFTIDVPLTVPGDVNGNGFVDLEDAIVVMRILSGIPVDVQINLSADVNGDHRIGIEELAYILQKTAVLR